MSGRRLRMTGYAAAGLAGFGLLAWALHPWKIGDVDPAGVLLGSAGLLATIVLAVRDQRRQQTDTTVLAAQLAAAVLTAEQRARRQLLGVPERTIDIRFEFRPAPAHNAEHADPQGRLSRVAGYYRRLRPARMVLTGAPGAGKTVLAVELMMMLLQDRAPGDPVPVRLPAADLGADPAVRPWLAAHLTGVYGLAPRSAQALVDAGLVLPVIDGLDELDATDTPGYASRAAHALRMFNDYQRFRDKAPLILTCRSGHYRALTAEHSWLEDAARIEILPVTGAQARDFITARSSDAGRWRTVLDRIGRDPNGPLAAGLATPWRLTLASVVYEQRDSTGAYVRDPRELTGPALDTVERVRDHLLAAFLPATLPGVPARAHRWLAVLAGYLEDNTRTGRRLGGRPISGTDIVLHELWPLAGNRPRVVALMVLAPVWLIALALLPILASSGHILGAVLATGLFALFVAWVSYRSWSALWPTPQRLSFARLRTPRGRRQLAEVLGFGLAFGLPGGLAFGWAVGPVAGLVAWLAVIVAVGLTTGLSERAEAGAPNPRTIVRDDFGSGLGFGLATGMLGALGLAVGLTVSTGFASPIALVAGLGLGLTLAIVIGFSGALDSDSAGVGDPGGLAACRYLALLLCTRRRRRLPWRLGRFLDRCYRAGLLRIAGAGYQFRHRELQDYLAAHPTA